MADTDYRRQACDWAGQGREVMVDAVARFLHFNESLHLHDDIGAECCAYCWLRAGKAIHALVRARLLTDEGDSSSSPDVENRSRFPESAGQDTQVPLPPARLQARDGRTLGGKGLRTREKLLDAALPYLTETPWRQAAQSGMADIARAAGFVPGTVWQYFGDVEEVLLAVVAGMRERGEKVPEHLAKIEDLLACERLLPKDGA